MTGKCERVKESVRQREMTDRNPNTSKCSITEASRSDKARDVHSAL